jgi:glycosyltransferase involved in cell wall biosynthesis
VNTKGNKHILFIAPSAYPLGGLATWLDYIVPGLEKKGWDVVFGLTSGKLHNSDAYLKIHPFKNAIKIENKTGSRGGRIRSIMRAIQNAKPHMVASVNIPDTYAAIERLREKSAASPKVIMTLHGIQPDLYEDAKAFWHVLDGVICTNKLACRIVQEEAGLHEDRILYAPYGVDLPEQYQRSTPSNPLKIAYSGRLDHFQKRVNDIPEILSALRGKGIPFECLIAGGGPAEKDLLGKIKELSLDDNVNFLGVLSYEDLVQQVYKKADILLITSFWETGPIVAWEAMSYGVAVVTSQYVGSGLEGSLKDGENCLLFPIGDTRRAAECIESLHDGLFRERIAKAGYQLVKTRYSRSHSIDYWHAAFEQILSKSPLKTEKRVRTFPPAGRLDRLFGVEFAETIRSAIGRKFVHNDPGGEWPHSYGKRPENDRSFFKLAEAIDSYRKGM